MRDAIQDLRTDERAIVICTHNLAEAEQLADRIAIIRKGVIVASGSPRNLKARILGTPEFEITTLESVPVEPLSLPAGVRLTGRADHWLRFAAEGGEEAIPAVLERLLGQGLKVVRLQESPRSLEEVYLKVMQQAGGQKAEAKESVHAG